MDTTGDLTVVGGEINFEWKIKDFLQLPTKGNSSFESPEFPFCGVSWILRVYPNGHKSNGSFGWISLYLISKSITAPIVMDYSLRLQTADGSYDIYTGTRETYVFKRENSGRGYSEFILRSKLIERKSELLPSGVLTVLCTLKKSATSGESDFLELQRNLQGILENGNLSDVTLKVGDQEFKSHRCLLAARSPVFLAMMSHDTKEKNTGVVDIQDVDPDTMSDFLNYLYTASGEIIAPENVVKLYTAADKYQVDKLKKSCIDYMMKNISVDNFCDVLKISLEHVEKNLTDACTQFFIENTEVIILTPKWVMFLEKNPVAGNELYLKKVQKEKQGKDLI